MTPWGTNDFWRNFPNYRFIDFCHFPTESPQILNKTLEPHRYSESAKNSASNGTLIHQNFKFSFFGVGVLTPPWEKISLRKLFNCDKFVWLIELYRFHCFRFAVLLREHAIIHLESSENGVLEVQGSIPAVVQLFCPSRKLSKMIRDVDQRLLVSSRGLLSPVIALSYWGNWRNLAT